jgi:K+-sensing histidine kinase KdpD
MVAPVYRASSSSDLAFLGGSLAAVTTLAVTLRAVPNVSSTTIALSLLLIVLATAALSRLWVATVVSVVAMLGVELLLPAAGLHLYHRGSAELGCALRIPDRGGDCKQSVGGRSGRTREAVERRNEVTRLFDLSRDVLLTTETASALDTLARHIARRFELSRVALYLPGDHGWRMHQGTDEPVIVEETQLDMRIALSRRTLEFDARQRAYGGHATGRDSAGEPVSLVPLRHGTKVIGVLVVGRCSP